MCNRNSIRLNGITTMGQERETHVRLKRGEKTDTHKNPESQGKVAQWKMVVCSENTYSFWIEGSLRFSPRMLNSSSGQVGKALRAYYFNWQLFNIYSVPGTTLRAGNATVEEEGPSFRKLPVSAEPASHCAYGGRQHPGSWFTQAGRVTGCESFRHIIIHNPETEICFCLLKVKEGVEFWTRCFYF